MKITAIELLLFDVPLPTPLANPISSGSSILTLVAVVRTDQGVTGQGYGWSIGSERARFISGATEGAARFALGRDPLCSEAIWSAYEAFSNFVGTSGLATIGMSILDIAFWDIQCKVAGQPLWKMLGGHKPQARMYHNLIDSDASGQASTAELVSGYEAAWQVGYRDFKARLGINAPAVDAARLKNFVAAIGPEARLAVDVAQRWSSLDALRACQAIDDLGLVWIEDPGHQDDYAGMRNIATRIRTPICTGENAYGLRGAVRVMDEISCPWLMLDLMRCGGITGWRKAAAVAESRNIRIAPHVYPQIGVHLVCGTANSPIGEYLPWWDSLYGGPLTIKEGYATPSDTPGVGAEIAEARFASADWRLRID